MTLRKTTTKNGLPEVFNCFSCKMNGKHEGLFDFLAF